MGVFWKRANKIGAIVGMVAGLGICLYYMVHTYPQFIQWFGTTKMDMWWGIAPISAGVFGVPLGLITIWVVSLLTPEPNREVQEFVEHVRYPNLRGDTVQTMAR
jgi:cation/acetate symporter